MGLCVLSRELSTSFEVYHCGWNSVWGDGVRLVRFDLGVCFGLVDGRLVVLCWVSGEWIR